MALTIQNVNNRIPATMGHSQSDKARSRERILSAAAHQIREQGLAAVSVGKLMQSVDLTHGGFYGHFASRSDLMAQALERALDDGVRAFETAGAHGPPAVAATVRGYLSRKHRDSRAGGCAIAALVGDVAREDDPAMRAAMAAHVEAFAEHLQQAMTRPNHDQALFAASAMIGALLVSRAMPNPAQADAVLTAAKKELLTLLR